MLNIHISFMSADQMDASLSQVIITNIEKIPFSSTCFCNLDLILINFVSQLK